MFKSKYKAANDRLTPSDEAFNRVLGDIRNPDSVTVKKRVIKKRSNMKVAIAWALCALFIIPAATGIIVQSASRHNSQNGVWALSLPTGYTQAQVADYSEVFSRITANRRSYAYDGNMKIDTNVMSVLPDVGDAVFYPTKSLAEVDALNSYAGDGGDARGVEIAPSNANAPSGAESNYNNVKPEESDYSDTNKQVAGVDEADVIKTDGKYIYVLNSEGVAILTASGSDTEVVGRIKAKALATHSEEADIELLSMYINAGQLIIIAHEYQKNRYDNAIINEPYYLDMYYRDSLTVTYIFDISDVNSPKAVSTLCQDGSYADSRLTNGSLYIISNYNINGIVYEDDVSTYVPCVYNNDGEGRLTPVEDICVMPAVANKSTDGGYTYITEIDLGNTADFSDTFAMLGYVSTVYCSGNNLLLCSQSYSSESKTVYFTPAEGKDYKYTISDTDNGGQEGTYYASYILNELYRIPIGGGKLQVAAQATVRGSLLNQFSIDEYGDFFRIVLTRDEYEYLHTTSEYEYNGETYSTQTNILDKNTRNNSLYVLDMGLETVGAIENIADDEMVKSVRFMGDVGYFVTFRQTDPLFSVDLSKPNEPKLLGELKIPGFSEYLQAWGEDMLFGFGQSADEQTGRTECLKLSMFDISDPSNVYEAECKELEDFYYSAASYNHKAILVAYSKGLIGFPADNGYLLYSYSEKGGFAKRAYVELSGNGKEYGYGVEMRGMYIGDCYYVIDCQNSNITVIDLNTFEAVGDVNYR